MAVLKIGASTAIRKSKLKRIVFRAFILFQMVCFSYKVGQDGTRHCQRQLFEAREPVEHTGSNLRYLRRTVLGVREESFSYFSYG